MKKNFRNFPNKIFITFGHWVNVAGSSKVSKLIPKLEFGRRKKEKQYYKILKINVTEKKILPSELYPDEL